MLSQQELADRAGVSLFTVQRIERGEGSVRPKTGRAIAGALGVGVEDLLGKAQAPLPDFEVERRDPVYEPWLEFVNRYAARWEQRIAEGAFGPGAVKEFIGTLEDLGPVLNRLGLQEKQEQPEFPDTYGPIMGEAIERLMRLLTPLAKAGHAQLEDSELTQLRLKRESLKMWERAADRAASG